MEIVLQLGVMKANMRTMKMRKRVKCLVEMQGSERRVKFSPNKAKLSKIYHLYTKNLKKALKNNF